MLNQNLLFFFSAPVRENWTRTWPSHRLQRGLLGCIPTLLWLCLGLFEVGNFKICGWNLSLYKRCGRNDEFKVLHRGVSTSQSSFTRYPTPPYSCNWSRLGMAELQLRVHMWPLKICILGRHHPKHYINAWCFIFPAIFVFPTRCRYCRYIAALFIKMIGPKNRKVNK